MHVQEQYQKFPSFEEGCLHRRRKGGIDKVETWAPSFSNRNLISGSARTLLISLLSRAASSGGVPCGAKNPTHNVVHLTDDDMKKQLQTYCTAHPADLFVIAVTKIFESLPAIAHSP